MENVTPASSPRRALVRFAIASPVAVALVLTPNAAHAGDDEEGARSQPSPTATSDDNRKGGDSDGDRSDRSRSDDNDDRARPDNSGTGTRGNDRDNDERPRTDNSGPGNRGNDRDNDDRPRTDNSGPGNRGNDRDNDDRPRIDNSGPGNRDDDERNDEDRRGRGASAPAPRNSSVRNDDAPRPAPRSKRDAGQDGPRRSDSTPKTVGRPSDPRPSSSTQTNAEAPDAPAWLEDAPASGNNAAPSTPGEGESRASTPEPNGAESQDEAGAAAGVGVPPAGGSREVATERGGSAPEAAPNSPAERRSGEGAVVNPVVDREDVSAQDVLALARNSSVSFGLGRSVLESAAASIQGRVVGALNSVGNGAGSGTGLVASAAAALALALLARRRLREKGQA